MDFSTPISVTGSRLMDYSVKYNYETTPEFYYKFIVYGLHKVTDVYHDYSDDCCTDNLFDIQTNHRKNLRNKLLDSELKVLFLSMALEEVKPDKKKLFCNNKRKICLRNSCHL